MKKSYWTEEEQRKQVGSAMAIATTANLLLGLRWAETGKKYTNWMVTQEGMDKELCETAGTHMLIYMLPFAVELCLKGLRSQSGGKFRRTHNLKSLWQDLDEAEQAELRTRVEDPAWKNEKRTRREALGITGANENGRSGHRRPSERF